MVWRLSDKLHSWTYNGINTLIPNGVLQGLLGYAYSCPDMIGGGDYLDFSKTKGKLDEELFVRYAQCAALFPMMQFSAAPWDILTEENARLCKDAAKTHEKLGEYIIALSENAAQTGEPIIRHMAYKFPDEDFELVNDQFMLGGKYLVAPVVVKGQTQKTVKLPKGSWNYNGEIIVGGRSISIPAPLGQLICLER